MKRFTSLVFTLSLFALIAISPISPLRAQATGLTIRTYASPAPNRHGSGVSLTAYASWTSRALQSIEGSKNNIGNPATDAGAFYIVNRATPRDWMVSANHSWQGKADPTGAFASQQGNRLHFVLHVTGNGTVTFKMEDISWNFYSNGTWWTHPTPAKGRTLKRTGRNSTLYNAAQQYVDCTYGWAYDWGADNTKGGTDDTKVCGDESKHQLEVDELFFVGPAYGHAVDNRYQDTNHPATQDWTVQQWLYAHCSFFNSGTDFKQIGIRFSIVGSDSTTYTHLADLTNPEHGQTLDPNTCAPYPPPATPVPTAEPTPMTHTAEELVAEGYSVSATHGLRSGLEAQHVAPSGVGVQSVLDAGYIDGVNLWGYAEQTVEVCFKQGSGALVFLDSNKTPRVAEPMKATLKSGKLCGTVNGPGSIILVESWPGSTVVDEVESDESERPLSDCMVTTEYNLNFRDAPAGSIIGLVPQDATLTAVARTDLWFKVDYYGVKGWISADYVIPSGTCD